MHTPKSIDTTHAKPSPTAPSNMADMAQKGSVLLGGVGGAITGVLGSIVGGYSSAIASSIAFGCAGAVIGTGGGIIICAGVIRGVVWLNSRNSSEEILQDKLNETSEEMRAQLNLTTDSAKKVLESLAKKIDGIQAQDSEQNARMNTAIQHVHEFMPTLNQAKTQLHSLSQPLQLAATTTEKNAHALTEEVHRLHTDFEIKACALQKIEKTLSEKETQLQETLDALANNQKQFTQLLSQQQDINHNAADIVDEHAHQAAEMVSLKTQVRQLSSKNSEFVVAMNSLLMEISALKSENKTLKETMQLLSLALDGKTLPQESGLRPPYAPTLFHPNA